MIEDAISWWISQARGIPGIIMASEPNERIGTNGVIFMAYMRSARLGTDADRQGRDLYSIQGLLVAPKADLKTALALLKGIPLALSNLVRVDPSMGGNVQTFGGIEVQLVPQIQWQAVEATGYTITITDVKIRDAL